METGRSDLNNYNNPFEQLKPSLEDARNHPELQLPPKIEATLEDAKGISAYVDPFDRRTRRMASFGVCPELSAIAQALPYLPWKGPTETARLLSLTL